MFAIDMLYSHCYYCLCLLLTCFIHIAIMRCMFEDNMHLLYHIYMVLISVPHKDAFSCIGSKSVSNANMF